MRIGKPETNEFLLSELQRGQERAFDFIFRKYYKALCAQAAAYINDIDLAQSLVQDCFIKLWENRGDAGNIKKLPAYLSFSVRNKCIDHLRKTKSIENLNENSELKSQDSSSEYYLLSREFEERLVVVLSSLPERSRMAFEYSRFENLTYSEIAEKMNITVKAVEALISRALKKLRKELKDYLPIIIILFKLTRF
ncbi:MAG: RNA polymerase sigma-70 factor [Draconibacterium sp.]|nr:RNA polymerase sigma-70 factor [Draconibacterium sp.]